MHNQRWVEISVGLFILLGAAALLVLTFKVSGLSTSQNSESFEVTACFGDIGGLKPRAKVTLAGVAVGRVNSINLDYQWFEACVNLSLNGELAEKLSIDTAAAIQTAGLLGDNYLSLTPGIEEEFLSQGSVIRDTQSALILEQLINQFISNSTKD